MANETVRVVILDKEYQVACPAEEREALMSSARLLDDRMRSIRSGGAVVGLERIAVMAALNLSNELIQTEKNRKELSADNLNRLSDKLDQALQDFGQ